MPYGRVWAWVGMAYEALYRVLETVYEGVAAS